MRSALKALSWMLSAAALSAQLSLMVHRVNVWCPSLGSAGVLDGPKMARPDVDSVPAPNRSTGAMAIAIWVWIRPVGIIVHLQCIYVARLGPEFMVLSHNVRNELGINCSGNSTFLGGGFNPTDLCRLELPFAGDPGSKIGVLRRASQWETKWIWDVKVAQRDKETAGGRPSEMNESELAYAPWVERRSLIPISAIFDYTCLPDYLRVEVNP
ncbi:hypothetical protein FB451DRAFT_1180033 [Mycena latifolia]|nr:hypothetical protein FB451DRAFT_1180033 [Mycena latifolia]